MSKALFEKGQKIFYPGADLSRAHLIESKITGVTDDIDGSFYYNTEHSYRVPETGIKATMEEAKAELLVKMKEAQKKSKERFAEAIGSIEKTGPKKLLKIGVQVQQQAQMQQMM